jgi:energy-coupling factor transport system ATP-binding protein
MPPLLRFERVSYSYPGVEQPALDGVDLQIGTGEFCLLAGLSGHGKSTLLRAACGLVPHFHGGRFAGRVSLAGLDTREHGPARLGALAGVLFQDPETQLVMSTVRAELALALESRGHGAASVARGVEEVALALGIDSLLVCSTSPPRSWTRWPEMSSSASCAASTRSGRRLSCSPSIVSSAAWRRPTA